MSWKCEICDSFNEESSRQCYVCGQPRSAESIREGKIRERKERISRINAGIYKHAYGTSKAVFVLGLAVSIITISIAIIIKIVNGQLDDLWHSATVVAGRVGNNIRLPFWINPPVLIENALSGPLKDFTINAQAVWSYLTVNASDFPHIAFEIVPRIAKKNLADSCSNGIIPMLKHISLNTGALGAVFAGLFSSVKESVVYLAELIRGMFNSAVKHFN